MEPPAPEDTQGAAPALQQQQQQQLLQALLLELPQAKSSTETFSLFAERVHAVFAGLRHLSILLLPGEPPSHGSASGSSAPAPPPAKGAPGKAAAAKGGAAHHKGTASQAQQQAQGVDGGALGASNTLQALRAGGALDWSNCCVFHLYAGRGPVVQAPPLWPVACTASCHAAAVERGPVVTGDYAEQGPHFLDWKALAERGCVSMAAVPLFSCNRPVAVLCLASDQPGAFACCDTLQLLGGLLAPYCRLLSYTTRVSEMRRLVNDIITPIAAQLAQQKHSQRLARLGCTVEEAPPGSVPADGKGISVAVGSHGRGGGGGGAGDGGGGAVLTPAPVVAISAGSSGGSGSGPAQRRRGRAAAGAAPAGGSAADSSKAAAGADASSRASAAVASSSLCHWDASTAPAKGQADGAQGLSHKRFESVIVQGQSYDTDGGLAGGSPDPDLDWSDFFFNLVSMAIVYVYFSKAAVAGESLVAITLCMGVAAFDIVLLVMRWLWFEHYINYGSIVLSAFQAYRVIILPLANTWMSWSLLRKMSVTPSWPLVACLGLVLIACIALGLQVRFFLHAPLQLASVLFAATSTPDICAFFDAGSNVRCVGIISALQLSLGLVLPSLCVYLLEGRGGGRPFLPHMQAKKLLLHM